MTMPLDIFRQQIAFNPWNFWQFVHDIYAPLAAHCRKALFQEAWMLNDFVSRSEMLAAITTAEERLTTHLGYPPTPRMVTETVPFSFGPIRLKYGKVRALGVETLDYIGNANVSLIDRDGDGLAETFTISQATSVTDPAELIVMYTANDGSSTRSNRIEPVNVSINAGLATITGAAWLLAKPALYDRPLPAYLNPTDVSSYVETLDIYQRTVSGVPDYLYPVGVTAPETTNLGTWTIMDAERGIVTLMPDYCTDHASFCYQYPTHIRFSYEAGDTPTNDTYLAISRYALAELARPICGCDKENQAVREWQWDLAKTSGDVTFQAISSEDLNNPLGTRRGAVWAWKWLNDPGRKHYRSRVL